MRAGAMSTQGSGHSDSQRGGGRGVYVARPPCLVGFMYVRVWEYEVETGQVDAFLAAYGARGPWAQLFVRAEGYAGSQLFRDVGQASRFLTVDRWTDAACWEAFLDQWGDDYGELDQRLHELAAGGEPVVEGAAPNA
jgi:quinol monooxygenase YgiN